MSAREEACDLLVAGSGAAGLAAAVTGAALGLSVVLAEKEAVLGGTTAWSGGWIWAPGNAQGRAAGWADDPDGPRAYLAALLGNRFDAARIDAFLHHAPAMLAFLETRAGLRFEGGFPIPDTYGHLPGAGTGGRSVIAAPADARMLGPLLPRLRPPLRETTLMGLTIQAGADLRAFLTATRRPAAALHVARRLGRHALDLALHGRAMQLRNGQALVARLLRAAADLGVTLLPETPLRALLSEGGAVTGGELGTAAGPLRLRARRGVVLATGGFPQDAALRAAHFPAPETHRSLAVPSATGDGLRLAGAVGGQLARGLAASGAWCPVSEVPWPDGRTGVFPHIIDRGKPGVIGVLPDGRRFCNEGLGYHDYVAALLAATPPGRPPVSWLVADDRFLRRYGLGIVRPFPVPAGPWRRRGYLLSAPDLPGLARAAGIAPAGLAATVAAWNRAALRGEDPEFGRGGTPYMRLQGDPEHGPNPCVAPILRPPFHAVRVIPGSFGCFAGLATDSHARVLDAHGRPVPGLYAAGADMASVFAGHYPAGGINLGPALTFGHVAALHAAGALAEGQP